MVSCCSFAFLFRMWAILTGAKGVGEIMGILDSKAVYLRDTIQDIKRESMSVGIQRNKKRKREDDRWIWVIKIRKLFEGVEYVLREVGKESSFLMLAKKRTITCKKIEALVIHENKGDMLSKNGGAYREGSSCGYVIPVKDLIGKAAATYLEKLQALLLNSKAGRIAICGTDGIGKTILMKHLHNSILKQVEKFDHAFWVSFPKQLSILHIQDAVAAAVKCDLSEGDDLMLRAEKLSRQFEQLGRFVLFLDGVTEARFSLEQLGISVPTKCSACKLVFATNSTWVCKMLDCEKVELGPLSDEEACQLFMYEAGLCNDSFSAINDIAKLLVKKCSGVPRMIVDRATQMCGIDDICEWRNVLYEYSLLAEGKLSYDTAVELECDSKKQKKDVLHCST